MVHAGNRTARRRPAGASVPTKITPPSIHSVLKRRRLFTTLERALYSPLIWVDGPAGCGKTTLIASYLRSLRRPFLWYQVDSGDAAPAGLFHFLGVAVQHAGPRTKRGLPKLKPEHLADIPGFARGFFRELGARFDKPVTLVFDNLQEAGESSALYDMLRIAQEELPSHFRMILISRADPAEVFARASLSRTLARVSWPELRLREEEAGELAHLLKSDRKERVNPGLVAQLCQQCEGWMAGLILLLQGAHAGAAGSETLHGDGAQVLFDYFAAEVFARRPERTRLFLLQTALLPSFTVDMAERLTGHAGTRALLTDLVRQHHFTETRAEQPVRYQYHPLFRAFLLTRAQATVGATEVESLRRRAADIVERTGDAEGALQIYLDADDCAAAARLISFQAPVLAATGRHALLATLLARLPEETIHSSPWLQYWKGVCAFIVHGVPTYDDYERAYRSFLERGDARGCYFCWMGIVRSLLVWRRFRQLHPWLAELRALQARFSESMDADVEEHVVYAALAAHAYVDPSLASIERWVTRAEHCVRTGKDVRSVRQYQRDAHLLLCAEGRAGKSQEPRRTARLAPAARRCDRRRASVCARQCRAAGLPRARRLREHS